MKRQTELRQNHPSLEIFLQAEETGHCNKDIYSPRSNLLHCGSSSTNRCVDDVCMKFCQISFYK